ncbi:MAG: ATP-binding protein [Donghicola eburneus]|nr:ATP-binding protein [Donghicola eburneus]MCI5038961.1 ATP-binding protein [Donghicola eburneus]
MNSLKSASIGFVLFAFVTGCLSTGMWLRSANDWRQHLFVAHHRGHVLFDHLLFGEPLPDDLQTTSLSPRDAALADQGKFERMSDIPRPALVTRLSIGDSSFALRADTSLKIVSISPKIRYPLSELDLSDGRSSRNTLAAFMNLMARYCSEAVLLVKVADKEWMRVEGKGVWHCSASPVDRRLLAILLALVSVVSVLSLAANMANRFTDFAKILSDRQTVDRTKQIQMTGPAELRAIIAAVNAYREEERKHLSERAIIMSGVSHDLGTPATRLRLRAATIEDLELRRKFEADIEQMTGIIESVLTYTRAELSTEAPRKLSLTSLVEAIVADYEDMDSPVKLEPIQNIVFEEGRSIFMSRQKQNELDSGSPLLVEGRPLALRRAIGNLIDNALKYGRNATIRLEADANDARILVEDEGGAVLADDLEDLTRPFKRGANAQSSKGFGMGLTIVSSIALEHGGDLTFGPGRAGTVAQLRIPRG